MSVYEFYRYSQHFSELTKDQKRQERERYELSLIIIIMIIFTILLMAISMVIKCKRASMIGDGAALAIIILFFIPYVGFPLQIGVILYCLGHCL